MYRKVFRNIILVGLLIFTAFAYQGTAMAGPKIVVNLASRTLWLFEDDQQVKWYPIAPGKVSSPTPTGSYCIVEKVVNPTWIDPNDLSRVVPSGPNNPLGYRWIGFRGVYGIHGTNQPETIGLFASNGCIRMKEADVEDLYERVKVGTPIEIFYNRVAIDKSPDASVVYSIYPDEYNVQKLDVNEVLRWIKGYSVADWVSEKEIADKIKVSDGKPTVIVKVFPVRLNGAQVQLKAFQKDNVTYLKLKELSAILNICPEFSKDKKTVTTKYGSGKVMWLKGNAYVVSEDLPALYKLKGMIAADGKYNLTALHN